MNETVDAVGSSRSGEAVEPSRWHFLVTRAVGVVVVLFGLWYLAAVYGPLIFPRRPG